MASLFSFLQGGVSPFRTLLNTVRPITVPPIKVGAITVADVVTPPATRLLDATSNILPTAFADVRASSANVFVSSSRLVLVGSNTARFETDPQTTSILGLLVEPSGTNIVGYSETWNYSAGTPNPPWFVAGATLTAVNTVLDPRGGTQASTLNMGTSSANAGALWAGSVPITGGAVYTFSAWVRKSASGTPGNFIRLTSNNTIAWNTGLSTKFALTSDWRRISITGVMISSGTLVNVGLDNRDETGTYDSTVTGSVDVWGAQLETGSLSSYIQTPSSAAVTRAADSISFTLGASQTSVQFTFDDGTTQTISGLTGGATYTIPTNLNRKWILYIDDATAASSAGDGSSAGSNTATAIGAWLQSGDGSSTGTNTTTGVGHWLQSGVGSSSGSNTSTATGAWLQAGVGSSAGSNTTTAVGAWLQSGVGSSAGANTTTATAAPIQAKVGSATGANTTTGVGAWLQSGVGSSAGSNTASATAAPIQAKVGSATGTDTAIGAGAWLQSGVGSAAGSNTATATGTKLQAGVGSSAGANTTTAIGSWLQSGVGDAAGSNFATGYSAAVANVGTSSGSNTATAVGSWLQSGVGSSVGANTSSAEALSSAVTWNPADKASEVALSSDLLTASMPAFPGSNNRSARGTTTRTTGVFEVTFDTLVTGQPHGAGLGLANSSADLTSYYLGHDTNSLAYYINGFYQGPGTGYGSGPSFGVGDVMTLELLASSAKVYKNGTLIVTFTTLPSGSLYPAISLANQTDSGTGNFGATTLSYLPIGTQSWDGSQTGAGYVSVGSATGANAATAVGRWLQSGVGTSIGSSVASAKSTTPESDFNNDFAQDFAGFPGSLGIGGDFSKDFSGDFPVVHGGQEFNSDFSSDFPALGIANIRSGVGSSAGSNIASGVSSVIVVEPPVVPEPEPIPLQVWQPAAEYRKVQAPRATRVFRTGTDLRRAAPSSMTRINRTGTEMRRSTSRSMKRQYG